MSKRTILTKPHIYKNNHILHMEFNNTITEMKISTEEFNNKLEQAEESMSKPEDMEAGLSHPKSKIEKENIASGTFGTSLSR